MIQAIIQNNNTGQTAVTDLPQSRMNMAGLLASIGIRSLPMRSPAMTTRKEGSR